MNVLSITSQNIICSHSQIKSNFASKCTFSGRTAKERQVSDVFESSEAGKTFKRIRLNTTKKLYESDFILSGKNMGEKSLSTFVLNRKSGKPEEIFIMAYKGKDGSERYEFYRPETKYCQALIGTCILNFYPEQKIIAPCLIFSNAEDMQNVGLRGIQLAAERMCMEKYKNIVIRPDSFNQNFYGEAGFDVLKEGRLNLPKCFYDNTECTDEDLAEFIEYVLRKTQDSDQELTPQENCFLVLSNKAKKDYAKFIEKQPIITGKNLEDFFYKRQTK